ncbi:MAG: hypothetical protein ACPF83_00535 [Flavobacteriales bacterium]
MKLKARLAPLVGAALLFGLGCSNAPKEAVPQGLITYDVSFPFNQNDLLQYIYPEEMEVAFRGDQVTGLLEAMGGIVSNQFIVNNRQKVFDQYLKTNKGKYHVTLDSLGIWQMLDETPRIKLLPTDSTTTIAGYPCKLTMAEFIIDSVPPIELWHTADIPIHDPNWCNQYHALDEFLLGYDIEHFGMRMRVRAKEVKLGPVDASRFVLPEAFEDVDYPGIRDVIGELLEVLQDTKD